MSVSDDLDEAAVRTLIRAINDVRKSEKRTLSERVHLHVTTSHLGTVNLLVRYYGMLLDEAMLSGISVSDSGSVSSWTVTYYWCSSYGGDEEACRAGIALLPDPPAGAFLIRGADRWADLLEEP